MTRTGRAYFGALRPRVVEPDATLPWRSAIAARSRAVVDVLLLSLGSTGRARSPSLDAPPLPPVVANDNREAAGTLTNGVLTVKLEVRKGAYRPYGPHEQSVPMFAFAEQGKPLQTPGPLLRVREGTTIRASVHNPTDHRIVVHGLSARRAAVMDTLTIPPGGTRDVSFTADAQGIQWYLPRQRKSGLPDRLNGFFTFNGMAWPRTERLDYEQGDSIRWRIVNATADVHPLHLHGFFYRITARGRSCCTVVSRRPSG